MYGIKKQKGFTLFELLAVIVALGSVVGSCFVVYVLWHFISKYW